MVIIWNYHKIKVLYNYYNIEVLPKKCNVNTFKNLTNHDTSFDINNKKRFEEKCFLIFVYNNIREPNVISKMLDLKFSKTLL